MGGPPVTIVGNLIAQLQKCRSEKNLACAKRLHAHIRAHQLESHPSLGNFLVPMLVDCGSLLDAQAAFDRLTCRKEYSWSSLILGYVGCGDLHHAFHLYCKMREDCVLPSTHTFQTLLRACARLKDARRGLELHAEIVQMGLEEDLFTSNTLVDMYNKCGSFLEARHVFDMLAIRTTVSWNALIGGYAENGLSLAALNCLDQMQHDGVAPDLVTAIWILKACASVAAIDQGRLMCHDILIKGLEYDILVGSTMVDMYAKCGLLAEAMQVFDQLSIRNVVSWTALIVGYAENSFGHEALCCFEQMQLEGVYPNEQTFSCSLKACGNIRDIEIGRKIHNDVAKTGLEKELYVGNSLVDMYANCSSLAEAQAVFDRLPVQDVVSWSALIAGYAEHDLDNEVLTCFQRMQLDDVSPDVVTFVRCLKACGTTGALQTGREIHAEIKKLGLETDLFVGSTLIDMYGKCGSVVEGREVFDRLSARDVVTWNAMVNAYGENQDGVMAMQCFKDMHEQGVKPDVVTFMCLLVACSHASLVLEGEELLKFVMKEHEIEPRLDHYTCMVDIFARAGLVSEAQGVVETVDCLLSQTSLLSACKNYGKVELGLKCFNQLIQLIPEDASAYLQMSDIYGSAGMLSDANKVDELRKHIGATKRTGSAIIEVSKRLYEFALDNDISKEISIRSEILSSCLREVGYVPKVELFSRHNFDVTY